MRDLLRVLYLSAEQCPLTERAQTGYQCLLFKPSEMGDTHVHFIRHVATTSRSSELHNLHRNAAEGLYEKVYNVHGLTLWHVWHGFEPRISTNVTDDWHERLQVCVHVDGELPEYST